MLTAILDGAEHCQWQCEQWEGCRSPLFRAGLAQLAKGKSRWVQVVRKLPLGKFLDRKRVLVFLFEADTCQHGLGV